MQFYKEKLVIKEGVQWVVCFFMPFCVCVFPPCLFLNHWFIFADSLFLTVLK